MLRRVLDSRMSWVKTAILISERAFGSGDYAASATYAASARDCAEPIYTDCYGLAQSLEDEGYGACAAWYEYAEEVGQLIDTACAMLRDCEKFVI